MVAPVVSKLISSRGLCSGLSLVFCSPVHGDIYMPGNAEIKAWQFFMLII